MITNNLNEINPSDIIYKNFSSKSESLDKNLSKNQSIVNEEKLNKVAKEFESILIYQMFKEMNKNTSLFSEEDSLIKKNQAQKIFDDFLTIERTKIFTEDNLFNLGLSQKIIDQYKNN